MEELGTRIYWCLCIAEVVHGEIVVIGRPESFTLCEQSREMLHSFKDATACDVSSSSSLLRQRSMGAINKRNLGAHR